MALTIPKGDYGYNLNFTVQDADGNAFNLTGYTITLKVWAPNVPGTLKFSGACTIDVAASGTCHYVLVSGNFDTVARYQAELELTKSGVVSSTRPFIIVVEESG